uniref:AAA+ ATPase domain-containing protein n=1 Tax=Fagus sylvatica TaxID=28930 RepID=A0A2N9IAI9_FAGSY
MADALISVILDQFASIIAREAEQEIRLVVGVDEEVRKLEGNLRTVKAVLNDAEKRQATDEAVKLWLKKLEDISYEMDDVLDEWNTAMIKLKIEKDEEENTENAHVVKKKVYSFIPSPTCCFHQVDKLFLRHDIAHKIKELSGKLDEIVKREGEVRDDLVNILLGKGSEEERSPYVISLVGMGGIGKTTLAQLAYNHPKVQAHFDKKMWICVSDPFDQCKVAKEILESIARKLSTVTTLQNLLEEICKFIKEKKFFLVLDDVWTEDHNMWEPFRNALKCGSQGSRILVTTRNNKVADMMGSARTINLEVLSEEDCWLVFSKIAFFGKDPEKCEELEVLGRQIAKKCKGLPLAAKTLGSLMRFKISSEQWENVLDSNLWELEDVEKVVKKDLFAPLLLSYYDLPSPLKRCFSYCAVYPKDYVFFSDELVYIWMAQGYIDSKEKIEIIARDYFENLAIRSFFQDFKKDEDDEGLPKTIYNLCNLQILKIGVGMDVCLKFPHGIGKLINLSILEVYHHYDYATSPERMFSEHCYLFEYPRGFGRLTSLRRLSHFYVSGTKDGCKLGELKDLNKLQGSLNIKGLGNVVDACEAENAQFKKKIHLHSLKLLFSEGIDNRIENYVSVLNALESPPNLKYLYIMRYRGTTMSPNWTMCLTKLKTLYLSDFENLEHLPPLGKLPVLESLIITRFFRLKKVGVEFLGIESENKKEDNMQIFPNLKSLKFECLTQWEEWIGIGGKREEEEDSTITIMPRLQHLVILNCPYLNSLPDFVRTIPLKELDINSVFNPILSAHWQREKGEEWRMISHIPNIKIDGKYVQRDGQEVKSEIGEYEQTIGTCLVFTEEGEFSGILVMFDCSCNRLKELPSSIGRFLESSNLKNTLKESHLSNLILTLKEYPMEACKLHLTVQDLSNNSLAGLPPEMGKRSLHLSIISNKMKMLEFYSNWSQLKNLVGQDKPLVEASGNYSLVSGPTPALLKYLRSGLSKVCWFLLSMLQFDGL